jgi:hypothetical protein
MKQSKDTLFLSSVLKLRFVTVSFISASQTSKCLMSKAHNVTWCWVPGCLKLWEEVNWEGSVPIQLAVTASSNSLKCVILYLTMFTLVSLFLSSLSLSLSLSHTHTHIHNDYHLLEVNYSLLYTACDITTPFEFKLFLWFPTVWSKLLFRKISNLQSTKSSHYRNLGKTSENIVK